RLLFWTSTSTGYSLWSAGHAGSARPHCTAPCQSGFHQLIRVGDRVVFPTFESGGRVDLRATDGLGSGSSLLKTICNQGCNPYAPLPFVTLGSTGYFNVQKERNRSELWQTDGTRAGTRLASTLAPDLAEGVNFLSPPATPIGEIQGQLVFPAGGAQSGIQLWAVRQPTGSRLQLTDVIDPRSASPRFFTVAGDRLYFLEDGVRLWRSDGTTSTTKPVPGAPLQPLGPFCNQAETLYFAADSKQVWRTDGTAEGTFPLTDNVDLDEILGPVCLAGNVYFIFIVTSFASPFPSSALWRSDGTVSGTTLVMDLSPRPTSLTAFESALYINDGSRLLQSDGTAAGTLQLAAVDGDAFLRVGSNVFFFDSLKRDLWKTDGTPSGTTKLVSLAEKGAPYPGDRVAIDGSLYFLGEGSAGSLWRSDGTEEGTVRILATSSEVDLYGPLQALGDHVYFVARTARGRQLWTSDGSSAAALTDPSLQLSDTPPLAAAGRLFFTADDGVHGFELWQTDGTAAGTRRVSDIAPGPLSSWPDSFTQLGDRLYFAAQDSLSGRELWALPLGGEPACVPTDTALCLQGGRFRVEATYWDSTGASFSGHTMALSADTGAFWFFDAANLEVAVKVLDGRPIDGHFWVFYGALSDVEYALTVTDTETGLSRVYQNPAGRLASVGDTTAFGPLGAYDVARPKEPRATASL
ncbi:MAG TPA: ELWxxDGT repeat protein, partial [Thermoanaerobaculia bacterium]